MGLEEEEMEIEKAVGCNAQVNVGQPPRGQQAEQNPKWYLTWKDDCQADLDCFFLVLEGRSEHEFRIIMKSSVISMRHQVRQLSG